MKAVQFELNLPKYAFTKAAGKLKPSFYTHRSLSCLQMKDVEKPRLPDDDWVEVKVTYGGICGSDLNLISLKDSPATSPFISFPFTLGHEITGTISKTGDKATELAEGDRVVIDPILACEVRGISPKCSECEKGNYNLCEHMNKGSISPGLLTGTCKDTGGSWSQYVVAHKSQIIPIPDNVSDENGVLVEPFSCALHTVMQNRPKPSDHVFIIGAGVIGICAVAAIRALDIPCKITVLAKYQFQKELASSFGADEVVLHSRKKDYVSELAKSFNAQVLNPVFGQPIVNGGADIVFECVGNKHSLHDAIRFTKKGGTLALLGLASVVENLDMTMIWLNELKIHGSFCYGTEEYEGKPKRTLQIAVELLAQKKVDLTPLITHRFPLDNYQEALDVSSNKSKNHSMKVLLEP
ncbi:zinc-dependent alcohol dehydrogenase [Salipaludibacillus aurantiacus]|uniref:Threonine dehydrogenase n=1 Tax=Salipaludibacillus aurantiacus TaxID=1601833 RepID=A0A1H9S9F9_9BACI|nr:zinc-binding dehydrogenase [Salipaludibacillus aurantiacus]SER80809.1 Threonine dehydrogenase [Salipaludibacillus aurantiacus]